MQKECIHPAVVYFNALLAGDLRVPMQIFKVARLFVPSLAATAMDTVNADGFADLRCCPLLNSPAIMFGIASELERYKLLLVDFDVALHTSGRQWWQSNKHQLPNMFAALKKILLLQPNLASPERVFAILRQIRQPQDHQTLNDWMELCVMTKYNQRRIWQDDEQSVDF